MFQNVEEGEKTMIERYKQIIGAAETSKRAVRAIGLMNNVRYENELDDHEKLERFNDIIEAYNFHSREHERSKEKTAIIVE